MIKYIYILYICIYIYLGFLHVSFETFHLRVFCVFVAFRLLASVDVALVLHPPNVNSKPNNITILKYVACAIAHVSFRFPKRFSSVCVYIPLFRSTFLLNFLDLWAATRNSKTNITQLFEHCTYIYIHIHTKHTYIEKGREREGEAIGNRQ